MSQTHALLTTLKKALKSQGLTYRDVGRALALSEASVKRLFAEENLSLARLDAICRMVGMEISDLVGMMDAEARRVSELTEEQERELVSDIKLLLVAFFVVNGWSFEDIISRYQFTEPELIRYLARLDHLEVIELLPRNRIKLRISPHFAWRRGGPIERFLMDNLRDEFLDSDFSGAGEALSFVSGVLSEASSEALIRRIKELAAEFSELNQSDRSLPLDQRYGYSMLLGLRPWRPSAFERLRRR